ncbi:hypothetical protein Sm713_46990 [Streptomyces sp. TS71-3]|nr:hypothetical protein Sm713_46990 [Streptomyces sp. TS71-3]
MACSTRSGARRTTPPGHRRAERGRGRQRRRAGLLLRRYELPHILLGIGGDNSNGSAGTFYEGVMTSGYPSDSTENAVQSSITSAGYGR